MSVSHRIFAGMALGLAVVCVVPRLTAQAQPPTAQAQPPTQQAQPPAHQDQPVHQDQPTTRRGRKYKVPPETSHIEVRVLKEANGKPLLNAAVVFHAVKDGKDEGNLEVKTNEDGKAMIDVIATGSTVGVQVIADGYATYAAEYPVEEASKEILIKMIRPRAQISVYQDTHGQASQRPMGVQEPARPTTPPVTQTPQPTNHTSDPNPLTPVGPGSPPLTKTPPPDERL